jgi:hypothetical protein
MDLDAKLLASQGVFDPDTSEKQAASILCFVGSESHTQKLCNAVLGWVPGSISFLRCNSPKQMTTSRSAANSSFLLTHLGHLFFQASEASSLASCSFPST